MSAPEFPLSLEILRQACAATGDAFETADPDTNYMARVRRGGRFFFAGASLAPAFPLNAHFAAALADDKVHMAAALEAAGVAVVPSRTFFADPADAARYGADDRAGRSPADALAYAEAAGYPLFAKLNRGTHGRLALRLSDANDLIAYMREARALDRLFHLQPVVDAPEARIFALDGRARFLYRREKLALVGDGKRTLGAILGDYLNDARFRAEPSALATTAETVLRLARAKRALGDAPAKGEVVFAADAANLSQGGALRDLALDAPDTVHAWAAKVGDATGLRVFGADVFCDRLDDPASYRVIEVNANPSLTGLWRAGEEAACLAIWTDVLDLYFKNG